jgi:sodium-dependent dicarboxylate transporter 2/3/5
MIAAAVLSAFVSNTATAVMMLPIVTSIAMLAGGDDSENPRAGHYAACLLIGLAWACSVGGLATVTGSPPNGILVGFMDDRLGTTITWGEWLKIGLPLTLVLLPLAWAVLVFVAIPVRIGPIEGGRAHIRTLLTLMGRPSRGEKLALGVFALTAVTWILHAPLTARLNAGRSPEDRFVGLQDGAIAIAAAIVLFLLPAGKGRRVLDWKTAEGIPWGVLLLFGGGLSLASAFGTTGLDVWLGNQLAGIGSPSPVIVLLSVTGLIVFMTELTSNTATASTMLPVLAAAADGLGVDAKPLVIAAALSASCAFMLPVATPPNAIVFGSGRVSIRQMATAGIWMNLISIGAITLYLSVFGGWVL